MHINLNIQNHHKTDNNFLHIDLQNVPSYLQNKQCFNISQIAKSNRLRHNHLLHMKQRTICQFLS